MKGSIVTCGCWLGLGVFLAVATATGSCGGAKDTGDTGAAAETGDPDTDHDSDTGNGGCIEETGDPGHDTDPPPDTGTPPDTGGPIDTGGGSEYCPSGMVAVEDRFCMDRYEASRPDATSVSYGSDESMATSRAGVLPWKVSSNSEAEEACEAAGKRLCDSDEWYDACAGPDELVYAYGDDYEAATCNGIDTHCNCADTGSECDCEDAEPYADCYSDCGGTFYLEPTGSFSDCVNEYGVYDLNGNLWEHTAGGDESTVRGGAYNCGDSEQFHRCDYIPTTWTPSALGFRCCHDGEFPQD